MSPPGRARGRRRDRAAREGPSGQVLLSGGVGTGLGLSICHSYVQAMGGDIRVRSEVGRGTTFEVVLCSAGESRDSKRLLAEGAKAGSS
ncbi:ATP-binding protein [Archangium sp.]|uniref:ATP-binding protein n=1 Tax=Archangium sp. TaxID=1872627 RepID=UPI00286C8A12|nr:ATP-binding protein [Archangium sp.]